MTLKKVRGVLKGISLPFFLEKLREKHLGVPSIFDIAVILFIVGIPLFRVPGHNKTMVTGMFLIFGSIVLMNISVGVKRRRDYRSLPMALLLLWCMVHIFWHSYKFVEDFGLMMINWTLLNEGYIYIFFGGFLILTIVRYAKSWGWYYPALIFSTMYAWKNVFDINRDAEWSMTPILSVLIAVTFVILRKFKKRWLTIPTLFTFIVVVISKWTYIWKIKWISRPDFWKACLERIRASRFLGKGYYHTINTMDGFMAGHEQEGGGEGTMYILNKWGRGWRQNDLLEFGEYMGALAMILIGWFFINLLWRGKVGLAYFFVLASTLACFFQRTMYFPQKGGLIVIMLSLLTLESCGRLVKTKTA